LKFNTCPSTVGLADSIPFEFENQEEIDSFSRQFGEKGDTQPPLHYDMNQKKWRGTVWDRQKFYRCYEHDIVFNDPRFLLSSRQIRLLISCPVRPYTNFTGWTKDERLIIDTENHIVTQPWCVTPGDCVKVKDQCPCHGTSAYYLVKRQEVAREVLENIGMANADTLKSKWQVWMRHIGWFTYYRHTAPRPNDGCGSGWVKYFWGENYPPRSGTFRIGTIHSGTGRFRTSDRVEEDISEWRGPQCGVKSHPPDGTCTCYYGNLCGEGHKHLPYKCPCYTSTSHTYYTPSSTTDTYNDDYYNDVTCKTNSGERQSNCNTGSDSESDNVTLADEEPGSDTENAHADSKWDWDALIEPHEDTREEDSDSESSEDSTEEN